MIAEPSIRPSPTSDLAPPTADAGVAIRVSGVGKMYRIYDRPQDRLKQMLFWRLGRSYGREFWALRDVCFDVKKGETVGIIGRNGSGKSSLLQIIAGTLAPTEGEVHVHGRVAALLELGSGFNPEFTGRENVFLNGAILGISRGEMEARFDEIAAFADIGEFIDQPVKSYSSGMVVRLAFAVAACVEPDILIVDEALAVGDVVFQARCLERIRQLRERGTTTLFVTHDIGTFQNLCDYGYMLDHGRVFTHGRPAQVAIQYYEVMRESEHARQRRVAAPEAAAAIAVELHAREDEIRGKTGDGEYRFGTGAARILDVRVMQADGREAAALYVGRPFRVAAVVEFSDYVENLGIGVMFRNAQGQNLFGIHSFHEHRVNFGPHRAGERLEIVCEQTMLLNPGDYLLNIGIADCRSDFDFTSLDSRNNLLKISVVGKPLGYGLVHTTPRFWSGDGTAPVQTRRGVDVDGRPSDTSSSTPAIPGPYGSARDIRGYTLEEVRAIYEAVLADPAVQPVVDEIMRHDNDSTRSQSIASGAEEERAWPSEPRFTATGYHRMMLGRYAFAGAMFCRDAEVLDTASGLGWGAFLVAHFARNVTAFDLDPRLAAFCREVWPAANIAWRTGNACDLSFLGAARYDVALGMEVIEHFTQDDSGRYVAEVARVLRPGGIFIGTSAFPASADEARVMASAHPYHLHVLTPDEMLALLLQHFSNATVIGGWMFMAVK